MQAVLIIVACLIAAAVAAVLLSVRIRVTVKGRGQLGDTWVVAGGIECCWLALSVAAAHRRDSVMQVHLLGRRIVHRCPMLQRQEPEEPSDASIQRAIDKLRGWRDDLDRRWGTDNLLRFAFGLRRRVRVKMCKARIQYSTSDVSWTGMLSGVMYMIAGLLSPYGKIEIIPEWDDLAHIDGDIDIVFRVWPGRVFADTLWFLWKNTKPRDATTQAAAPAQS